VRAASGGNRHVPRNAGGGCGAGGPEAAPAAGRARLRAGASAAAGELLAALGRFVELLPEEERAADPADLLDHLAATNALHPLRRERGLPVTVVFTPSVHPAYFTGDGRIGAAPWRIVYTDGGPVGPCPARARLLDEAIRLAEAMHDKNPFGEVPFDGGKTVLVQEGPNFQAVTALYGDLTLPAFILAKGGVRYYPVGPVGVGEKRGAVGRWAASSALAGVLAHRYIGGPDMRMGEPEMAWVEEAVASVAAGQGRRHPAVTGLSAAEGGFPHQAWELTGRTVAASLKEALRHPAMAPYGLSPQAPVRVLIQGFGDVGGSVARLLTEESPDIRFRVAGVADEYGALYRADGLDVPALLRLRAGRRPITEYAGPLDALWVGQPADADRGRPGFRGSDSRELVTADADVFIPAAVPDVIDAALAPRLRVRVVAEGANNAVRPRVEEDLHRLGVLYLPGQALNWGGVKGSTLEVLFRESTRRTLPLAAVEGSVGAALAALGPGVDAVWALELLRSGVPGSPLGLDDKRAFAVAVLEDLARSNTRWLMDELLAAGHLRHPLDILRGLSRGVRALKVQLLSLIEHGLGPDLFAAGTPLRRLRRLLDDRLKELPTGEGSPDLTSTQVVEQRQLLQQLQADLPNGLSPVLASLLAALDLARQKVMDPDGYAQDALRRDLAVLRRPNAPTAALEASLYRLQRVHPGPDRAAFTEALAGLVRDRGRPAVVRRNAALSLAKLGTADPGHCAALREAAGDADPSVRALARWALHQMAMPLTDGEPAA
jgi:glutamate dehydrogenase/leucine dehydrogenase